MKQDKQRMRKDENTVAETRVEKHGSHLDARLRSTMRGVTLALILVGAACVPAWAQVGPVAERAARMRAAAAASSSRTRQVSARTRRQARQRSQTRKPVGTAVAQRARRVTSPSSASNVGEQAVLPKALEWDGLESAGRLLEGLEDGTVPFVAPQIDEEEDDAPTAAWHETLTKASRLSTYKFGELGNPTLPSLGGDFARPSEIHYLSEIKDKHKAYILTFNNEDGRKKILAGLQKYPRIEVVATREEADFTIIYTDEHGFGKVSMSSNSRVPMVEFNLTGKMSVSVRGEQKPDGSYAEHVLWVDTNTRERLYGIPFGPLEPRHPATNLTRHFIDALRKVRGEKKS